MFRGRQLQSSSPRPFHGNLTVHWRKQGLLGYDRRKLSGDLPRDGYVVSLIATKEGIRLFVPYGLGFLTQTNQALEQRSRMVIDGQQLRHKLQAVKWKEVGESRIIAKGKNSSRWTSLRQEVFRPKMLPTVPLPCPGYGPIATKSVYEDDTALLARVLGR